MEILDQDFIFRYLRAKAVTVQAVTNTLIKRIFIMDESVMFRPTAPD